MKIPGTNPRFFYYFLWTSLLLCVFVSSFFFFLCGGGGCCCGNKKDDDVVDERKKVDLALKFRGPQHSPAFGVPFLLNWEDTVSPEMSSLVLFTSFSPRVSCCC